MKTLGKIKLNQFSKDELEKRKMNTLKGGCECVATCRCNCSGTGDWHALSLFSYGYSPDTSGSTYNY